MDTKYSFKSDSTGFLTQQCSRCERRFKVRFKRKSEDAPAKKVAHCPYCDRDGEGWWTPEQAKFLKAIAAREVSDLMNQSMKSLKGWKSGTPPTVPPSPVESNDDLPAVTTFGCCDETIRHDGASEKLRCIICGTAQQ